MSGLPRIEISIAAQQLQLYRDELLLWTAAVSTARNGPGQQRGSECTPLGWHVIRARIGADCPPGAVLVGRRWTGEIYSPALRSQYPERDWILTRILWLGGLEKGFNRMGSVDTQRRYIYIHGCPDEEPMGMPLSHGCVRMRNDDVRYLFDQVPVGTRVHIA